MFTAAQPRAGAAQKNRAREQDSPRPTPRTQVFFEDVRVPAKNLIGEEGQGFTYQMLQFQEERLFAAANLLRTLDRILDETAEYAMNRQIFGKPLLANQVPASCAYVPRPSAYTPRCFCHSHTGIVLLACRVRCLCVQVVQYRLCELETEVEALRSLTYRATHLYIQVNRSLTAAPLFLVAELC